MTTTSSFRSRSVLNGVLLMMISLLRNFHSEVLENLSKNAVECGERMNHIGERLQRSRQLDRQHELAEDFARTRRDQGRTDQGATLAIADQFDRALVEIMDVAAGRLRRIGGRDHDVEDRKSVV